MKIAIHQPQYLPWPRYIHKVISADIFVYLDTVQFSKNGPQNRNQIKTSNGPAWLTVPVKHHFGQTIAETEIATAKATAKHWRTIQANYARTEGLTRFGDQLQSLLELDHKSLSDLAIASTEFMLKQLNAPTKRMKASDLTGVEGQSSERVASICKALQADTYLTGQGALTYLDPIDFDRIECAIEVQEWTAFEYKQSFPEAGFVPDLSTIDLLLNCPDDTDNLIRTAGRWVPLQNRK